MDIRCSASGHDKQMDIKCSGSCHEEQLDIMCSAGSQDEQIDIMCSAGCHDLQQMNIRLYCSVRERVLVNTLCGRNDAEIYGAH